MLLNGTKLTRLTGKKHGSSLKINITSTGNTGPSVVLLVLKMQMKISMQKLTAHIL